MSRSSTSLTGAESVALRIATSLYGTDSDPHSRRRSRNASVAYVTMLGLNAAIAHGATAPHKPSRADRTQLVAGWGIPAQLGERLTQQVMFSEDEVAKAMDAYVLQSHLGSATVSVREIDDLIRHRTILAPDAQAMRESLAWGLHAISAGLNQEGSPTLRGAEPLSVRDRIGLLVFDFSKYRREGWATLPLDLSLPSYALPKLPRARLLADLLQATAEDRSRLDAHAASAPRSYELAGFAGEQVARQEIATFRDLALVVVRDILPRLSVPNDPSRIKTGKLARRVAYYRYRTARPSLANVREADYGRTLSDALSDLSKIGHSRNPG